MLTDTKSKFKASLVDTQCPVSETTQGVLGREIKTPAG